MSEKLVEEWISKAEEDFRSMEELYRISVSEFANTICFHAQQCAEKYLKALLTKYGIEPPWIHTLEALLDLLTEKNPALEENRSMLAQLTPYGTEYRYPGKFATAEEAEDCYDIIIRFRKNVQEFIK